MAILTLTPNARPATATSASRRPVAARSTKIPGARKIVLNDLAPFTRQLGAMLSAGMPLVQTLSALEDQTQNKVFKQVIGKLRAQIEGGAMFSEALVNFPTIFDELYVGLIRAGETGGILTETIEQVAGFLEASGKLRRKVKSAMMYPMIIMILAGAISTAMIVFVVPVFAGIYKDFGGQLPGPTQFLLNVSDVLRHYGIVVIVLIAIMVTIFQRYRKTEAGNYQWDNFCLHFPVVGILARKIAVSRFASVFAQLVHSGVPILRSLEIVATATGNKVLGKVLLSSRGVIERGEPLSSALRASGQFPPVLVHMLSAGERTGKIDEMLKKISEFYDDEVGASLAGLTSMLEPLLMVVLGVVIGGIVLCMFLPIFKMHELVSF
ncbi:MAG: type II secretion system F family protein [Verrucomicrobia bacterium]|nr:MAG: type II secretion system F family protein [Verrucomicrobiota bacterium]